MVTNEQLNEQAIPLWSAYSQDRSLENRNALVAHYYQFAKQIARRRRKRLATDVQTDRDDLIGYASMALIDLVTRFDQGRGLKFTSFATLRINGAITDGIRNLDWVPRLERKAQKLGNVTPVVIGSLDAARCRTPEGDDSTLFDVVENRARSELSQKAEADQFWASALVGLSQRDRLLLLLYYREHQTMRKIGEVLGLSESRVSQLHSTLLKTLKRNRFADVFIGHQEQRKPCMGTKRERTQPVSVLHQSVKRAAFMADESLQEMARMIAKHNADRPSKPLVEVSILTDWLSVRIRELVKD